LFREELIIIFGVRLMPRAKVSRRELLSVAAVVCGWLPAASLYALAVMPIAADAGSVMPCVAPADLIHFDLPLSRTAHRLHSRDLLTIVALGSSSTAGAGASSPSKNYPTRLATELAQLFPFQPMVVLNRGVSGELAVDMLARLDKSVLGERPDLVLWQLGTNAVLRGYRWSPSTALIHDGIGRMKAIGADVVLIDPQFAPKVIARPEIADMIDLISVAAKQERVDLFHRFALMRHWREVEGMSFEAFVSADGLHMNDWSYGCLAKDLAGAIAAAATPDLSRARAPMAR
jgi:acyl-CoA thioesterase-1